MSEITTLSQFLANEFQFLVPLLAELPDERIFQKLIEGETALPAKDDRRLAHLPSVVVHPFESPEILDPDRIKMAGDRFAESDLPDAISFLQSTAATTFLVITSKDAILSAYDRRHQIAFLVDTGYALPIDNGTSFPREVIPDNGQGVFDFQHFLRFQRSSGIAFDATGSPANIQVAEKFLPENIQ